MTVIVMNDYSAIISNKIKKSVALADVGTLKDVTEATRGLMAVAFAILNHCQVTRMNPELALPFRNILTMTPADAAWLYHYDPTIKQPSSEGKHPSSPTPKKTKTVKSVDNLVALHFKYDQARRRFVKWAQKEIAVVPDFHERILFSDEAHFWLNGYVNKQNCRIWSETNPQVYVETPLHPEKLTAWCALWAGGIIGPYFFKNDEGHNVTVNGDRYRAMITNFFIPELNNHEVQELWFQQDGATCHTARATIDLLKDTFGDRLISRFGPVNWPPRYCDLTPLDYFLWGYVKSLVYADKPQTPDHLEDNIHRVFADIRPQMLEKVMENWTSRLDYIRASRGSPMPEITFKM
ncbi:putative transposable element [Trichonephila clavipes]|nr:putative transposable element [Trichonephila clavipes]